MMPLALANIGEEYMIHKVSGNPETRKHLEDLGFVAGGPVTVVSYHLIRHKACRRKPRRPSLH